jgi:imidazole glycerol-phosphate synthase subunit HisH|tara:strand:- start:763 stop:1398 length:636 start_codon:yes stop_codon:yes gene_type:complete
MNIAIIDYGSGNIKSVINSFKVVCINQNIETKIDVTSDLKIISNADKIILPGQGSFKNCVESLLKINGLKDTLNDFAITKKKPLLGICVGMQMFADIGFEETETKGLGWISGNVEKIDNKKNQFKLPHIGWNELSLLSNSKLFKDIKENSHVYFVHSYKFVPSDEKFVSSKVTYSEEIVASIENNNLFGTQFHPEKSDTVGLKIIENFIKL